MAIATVSTTRSDVKGKGFPYSLPSVGPRADPSVQAVTPQVTIGPYFIHLAVGCHYFSPGLRLPSQPQSITAPWLVPSYTAWWQRHIGVNNLPKVVISFALSKIWTHILLIASPTLYLLCYHDVAEPITIAVTFILLANLCDGYKTD